VRGKITASGDLSGFLDVGTEFHGELSFQDTLRIDGKFEGTIREGRLLIIGESAEVNAEIHVATISVSGRLRGSVHAKDRVEINASARCQCNLDTRVLVVEEGAMFEGSCAMAGTATARELTAVPAPGSDKVKRFGTSE
jgi:cytoskeletal protein CcmA (bactofilin family)